MGGRATGRHEAQVVGRRNSRRGARRRRLLVRAVAAVHHPRGGRAAAGGGAGGPADHRRDDAGWVKGDVGAERPGRPAARPVRHPRARDQRAGPGRQPARREPAAGDRGPRHVRRDRPARLAHDAEVSEDGWRVFDDGRYVDLGSSAATRATSSTSCRARSTWPTTRACRSGASGSRSRSGRRRWCRPDDWPRPPARPRSRSSRGRSAP